MGAATTSEQQELAFRSQTSRGYLYQLANSERNASADLAARIEQAAGLIQRKSKGRLPKISRMDVCKACALCPFAQQCNPKK